MPEKPTASHHLRTVKPASDTDGPTYDYRSAVILTNKQGTNCTARGSPARVRRYWVLISAEEASMAKTPRSHHFMPLLAHMLAACARSTPPLGAVARPATPEDARYARQMRGAAAEAAYSGRRNFSIDSAMARS
jgi:hypothetical protein